MSRAMARGMRRTRPLMRRGSGMPTSSRSMVRPAPSQWRALGPTEKACSERCMDARPALGHGPAFSCPAIERHVDGAEVFGICCSAAAARPRIIGREHAAHEGDDGERVAAALAYGVDIPPGITTARGLDGEARSSIIVAAASQPEIAAIGTPGPGCTLPPAR